MSAEQPFKNLTQANYDQFKKAYVSDDEVVNWPTLEQLIAHGETRHRDGSNAEMASAAELKKRFATRSRGVVTPCDIQVATVLVDLVTIIFGVRELIKHRTAAQLEELFLHAGLPTRDVGRTINVLGGGELPYSTKAWAVLRLLKFIIKGGGSALVLTTWSIIVKNLKWYDLVLFGVEIGTEWVAFFATDGVAAVAMIAQELDRAAWTAVDIAEAVECFKNEALPSTNAILNTDKVGIVVQAVDYPNPVPPGGYLQKSGPDAPEFYMQNNNLHTMTGDVDGPGKGPHFLTVQGTGYFGNFFSRTFIVVKGNKVGLEIHDQDEVVIFEADIAKAVDYSKMSYPPSGDYLAHQSLPAPRKLMFQPPPTSGGARYTVHKLYKKANAETVYDRDQFLLQSVDDSTTYVGIVADANSPGGCYIDHTKNPQVWTILKTDYSFAPT